MLLIWMSLHLTGLFWVLSECCWRQRTHSVSQTLLIRCRRKMGTWRCILLTSRWFWTMKLIPHHQYLRRPLLLLAVKTSQRCLFYCMFRIIYKERARVTCTFCLIVFGYLHRKALYKAENWTELSSAELYRVIQFSFPLCIESAMTVADRRVLTVTNWWHPLPVVASFHPMTDIALIGPFTKVSLIVKNLQRSTVLSLNYCGS